jgi:hypothetical protein
LGEEIVDHEIWTERNKGGFTLSIIARLKGPRVHNVQYMVRLGSMSPSKCDLSFMLSLDGFKELGELFIALHDFCREPIFANETNVDKLRILLTSENIKNYAQISALKRGEKR